MQEAASLISSLSALPPEDREKLLASLTDNEAAAILYDWHAWARENQLAPAGDWSNWLILAGRGFGKTRTGAEAVREEVEAAGDRTKLRIALVGPTTRDVRKVMVEGESGILACSPPWFRPLWSPSVGELLWPNGALGITYTSEEPERLRGPQHHFSWCDELCAWSTHETWDMLQMTLRLGTNPRNIITTTPKPQKLIRELKASPATRVTGGSTYDNTANLPRKWIDEILKKYQGTRTGRQELYAEILDDTPGALWTRVLLEVCRRKTYPELVYIVVSVDPAVTATDDSDDTGIIVIALGVDGHAYVLRDLTCHLPATGPGGWAARAVNAYKFYQANCIIGEVNNGGDLVEAVIHQVDARVPFRAVRASRGKFTRAEPIAELYEQKRIHHVEIEDAPHEFSVLEDQQCNFVPGNMGESPDNMDALVWGAWALFVDRGEEQGVAVYYDPVRISPY
jgi:phage terminase large subunit-like protein